MGLFDSPKIFNTSEQIHQALFRIKSLDDLERAKVMSALVKELDDGGVTTEELKKVVHDLRLTGKISEIDKKNLLNLIG
ncbi:MAG: hypothetical protein PHW95_00260 [Patescibacteria group bacterium]|nr:hypothetical protein [Patescibacteria group bacterium]